MKKYIIITILAFLSSQLFSQETDSVVVSTSTAQDTSDLNMSEIKFDKDGLSVYIGREKNRERNKKITTDWIGLDIGFEGVHIKENKLIGDGLNPFDLRPYKSTNLNLHIVRQHARITKGFGIEWGLTMEFHKYMFNHPVIMPENQDQATFELDPENKYRKYRWNYSYLSVPLLFSFETNPEDVSESFHFQAGVYGGVQLGSNFKVKGGGDKMKTRDDFNLNLFRYGLRAAVGYGPITIYGMLALNDLFDKEHNGGYVVQPYSVGISVIPF